ncbi:uncharacterized protein LOC113334352 [Papaver somniferum]|uniref:uncharacterized protein LOC113334352 n=1 Tax=Papaver somniferum TaxID=3469 RepID=UPI000E6F957A|nr:uncharacterized protein LOC113334352 [Papaver somniferum]
MMNCMMSCMERSQVKARYTGGRKGVPRTWHEMEKESPTGEIYRPYVFVKTHKVTPDDNPSSSKSLAAATLALVQRNMIKILQHKSVWEPTLLPRPGYRKISRKPKL